MTVESGSQLDYEFRFADITHRVNPAAIFSRGARSVRWGAVNERQEEFIQIGDPHA